MQYPIFEGNLERLEQKLVRIQNKCKKYDCSFTYEKIGEEFKEVGGYDIHIENALEIAGQRLGDTHIGLSGCLRQLRCRLCPLRKEAVKLLRRHGP